MSKFTLIYCKLTILLIPFWTLPFIPGSFKPISIFLLFPLAILYLTRRLCNGLSINKDELYILIFLLLSVVWSLIMHFSLYNYHTSYIKYLSALTIFCIGVLSYFGFKYIIYSLGFVSIYKYLVYASLIVVIIGWIDFLGWLGLLPSGLRVFFNEMLSGKSGSRIILTTSEPAWASRLVLCLLPFIFYYWKIKKNRLSVFIGASLVLFFVFSFSISGFVVLIFTCLVYLLLSRITFKLFLRGFLLNIVLILMFYGVYLYLVNDVGGYFVSRIGKFTELKNIYDLMILENLASIDGSALIRIGYPIISTNIFMENPWGVGIGQYGLYFNDHVSNYGKVILDNVQVAEHIKNTNADQRSFYLKVLSENGLLISMFLVLFYYNIFRKLLFFERSGKHSDIVLSIVLKISMILVFANMIQFASYLFPFYWLIPALISVCYEKRKLL